VLLVLILGLWVITPYSSNAVIVSAWGDVVTVKYTLSVDGSPYPGNIDQVLDPIYLSTGSTVPSEIVAQFPGVAATYLLGFKQGIIGLQVNEEKSFIIDAADAYTEPTHALYGKDLFFDIELLAILFDAVVIEIDTVPPSIEIINPVNDIVYFTDNVWLNFSHDEPCSWIGYSLDDNTNITITGNTLLTSVSLGQHFIIVFANDTVGNMATSLVIWFTVENPSTTTIPITTQPTTTTTTTKQVSITPGWASLTHLFTFLAMLQVRRLRRDS
jgi:hypothetical protein